MLEVCFNDSVKGALALAQHCGQDQIGGAASVLVRTDKKGPLAFLAQKIEQQKAKNAYQKRQRELQKLAVPLGGRREDIAGLSFGLSEGDIQAPVCLGNCPRKEALRPAFSFARYDAPDEWEASFQEFWSGCIQDLQKVQAAPPCIRVWLDHTPDAQCGLLFLADLLEGSQTEFHIVELPQKLQRDDGCIVEYRGWGEVEPQLYGTFLDRERVLTGVEVTALAGRWRRLQKENAPLRVVKDGAVVSAEASYYDDLIRREFPQTACKAAQIIGGALGRQNVPTGDVFIAKRLRHFINAGELIVLEEPEDGFYSAVVARAQKP